MANELLHQLADSVIECDPEATLELTKRALEAGVAPLEIVEGGLTPGLTTVGERYAAGEFFLSQLVIAARCMQQAMALLQPLLAADATSAPSAGTVVIGTVAGDIHEIGKSLVATMLAAGGLAVHDLGVNVPADMFVAKVQETGAQIVGLSALLTTTMTGQRQVIEALAAAGLRSRVKVMIGGAPVNQSWCEQIGADGYAEDAVGAVALARRLLQR